MIRAVACVGTVLGVTPVAAVGSVNTVAFVESIIGLPDDACIVRVVGRTRCSTRSARTDRTTRTLRTSRTPRTSRLLQLRGGVFCFYYTDLRYD